jgi:hypothetical protein
MLGEAEDGIAQRQQRRQCFISCRHFALQQESRMGGMFGIRKDGRSKGRDLDMKLSNFVAAAASISLMAAPAMAAPQGAQAEVAPASESVDGQEIYGASVLLQLGILIAIAAAIYLGAKALDKDKPASP